jgi:hypothetical protein
VGQLRTRAVAALSGVLHYQPLTGRVWRYDAVPGSYAGLPGATLAYRRSMWERNRRHWRSMQPDFIFVSSRETGELAASIVDPHSSHLADALLKLVGLVDFAERHADDYLRIDPIDENSDNELVVLNMKDENVRAAVRNATNAADLCDGPAAIPYK